MTEENNMNEVVDVERILRLLPHRYPFLLVDKVISYKKGESITAIKNVTFNEPHFTGHFPNHPVMPGVLIIEAMAQASGVLSGLSMEEGESNDKIYYLVKVDKAKFTKTVVPGDQLHLHATIKRTMRNMVQYACHATVDGKTVAQAELLCASKS
ncbi:MAG: 3-hydroxyacyl-ACP dehydratase FabZ [Gammaproteobacteria bacterium]|nr:3-hydroxyacyl-ACP dehydratase FabZ [Xanthomonadales bacterium]